MARTPERKRARKGSSPDPAPPAAEPAVDGWTAREEALPVPGRRLSLPSSGLAEDILALAEPPEPAPVAPAKPSTEQALEPAAPTAPAPRAHNISFFAAPMREERQAVEASEHLVTMFLSDEEYGIDVRLVQTIIRVTEITPVPRAPGFIKGVINLRGRIIPVVDLKRKLNLGEVDTAARASRIAVVKVRERLIGLLVDGASQVLRVPLTRIEAAPEEVVEIDANYIRGVAKLDERLIILMDLQKILALELKAAGEEGGTA
jgi:purine-binding chemotaxis protein CheW